MSKTARSRRRAISKRAAARRVPSATAKEAEEAFLELRTFFKTPGALREALGWTHPTLRHWLSSPPARPRLQSADRVIQLQNVAQEAARWVSDPWDVGEWLLTPNDDLNELSPAHVIRVMGKEGAEALIKNLGLVGPRRRIPTEPPNVSPDAIRATLDALNVPRIKRVPPAELDLSDFDN